MDLKNIAEKIISLKNADLELRDRLAKDGQLGEGYNEDMKNLHTRNAEKLEKIIDQIGYPTADKLGKEASEAAWLVIQHSINHPGFMKKCMRLLEAAAHENESEKIHLAYLTDRIAVFEDKPQRYGTQFDWDENGMLSPNFYDSLSEVNENRKSLGLNLLEEQISIIRTHAQNENQQPPKDPLKRKQELEAWKKAVGWIK
ncbi:hypothetical protein MKJ01_15570 [Chryseobacterium sp. SSA4.19]|uniref:DUF6624 domain-containing protein n=1 Tax=Chryseobacterium sp. SSA4.19 TaxID=2919915 RepID=UPI001F4E88F7|nr:DUF6624 domain-containing protein [Chryseobacterium sp. SSA4.19]MCJ8155186.1 hypothetical protein [Chryseobacterium sp. SSA4.19]